MKSCDQNIGKINGRLVAVGLPMTECSTLFKLVERELTPFFYLNQSTKIEKMNRINVFLSCCILMRLMKEQLSVLLSTALDENRPLTLVSGSSSRPDIPTIALKTLRTSFVNSFEKLFS